jgi:hypothetical protein
MVFLVLLDSSQMSLIRESSSNAKDNFEWGSRCGSTLNTPLSHPVQLRDETIRGGSALTGPQRVVGGNGTKLPNHF